MAARVAESAGQLFDAETRSAVLADHQRRASGKVGAGVDAAHAWRDLGTARQAGAIPRSLGLCSRAEKRAVFILRRLGGANRAAVDARRRNAYEYLSVESSVARYEGCVHGAFALLGSVEAVLYRALGCHLSHKILHIIGRSISLSVQQSALRPKTDMDIGCNWETRPSKQGTSTPSVQS